ncbi:Lrp/AsnC family transcriptional regulator [Kordiimonas sp. SCSIO 12610]|uniref:Lrp/AsnC family transcriptional regulator n=1 Tax=Kordiimonas sp. SCSIO 12610 TaxID=2829597 RepID=UPI00210C01C6|nr:Lrp/AsnC family transcriptional regulator [Kordiimonas sp. SCSIO 12610]UTW54795.1 Lrp/AsnC family transcriptional regulator [Kordiimonas sp. SCSIO 12610]
MSSGDSIDNKILALLRENARMPLTEISKRINRSRTAVQARIHKLETTGVIKGYTILQTPYESDQITAIITVYLHERLSPEGVVDELKQLPEIRTCYQVSGDADLVIEIAQVAHDRIQEICKMLWDHENVRLTETVFIMNSLINN